jgi:hypothetical protein
MGSFMLKSNQQDWHFYLCETLAELQRLGYIIVMMAVV